jgi:hypothetical protein
VAFLIVLLAIAAVAMPIGFLLGFRAGFYWVPALVSLFGGPPLALFGYVFSIFGAGGLLIYGAGLMLFAAGIGRIVCRLSRGSMKEDVLWA